MDDHACDATVGSRRSKPYVPPLRMLSCQGRLHFALASNSLLQLRRMEVVALSTRAKGVKVQSSGPGYAKRCWKAALVPKRTVN